MDEAKTWMKVQLVFCETFFNINTYLKSDEGSGLVDMFDLFLEWWSVSSLSYQWSHNNGAGFQWMIFYITSFATELMNKDNEPINAVAKVNL